LNQASIVDLIPTLVLIDIPYEDQISDRSPEIRTPSPGTRLVVDSLLEEPDIEETYGLKLLQWIASEIQYQSLSKLIVPVAIVAIPKQKFHEPPPRERSDSEINAQIKYNELGGSSKLAGLVVPLDQVRTIKYLDVGAVDVLTSPLLHERLPSLGIHAYRAHRDASKDQRALLEMKRGRKRSWVGVDDQKPYAYLREAMVSGLMDGICKLGGDEEPIGHVRISVALERRQKIAESIGSWLFSAHDFTDDELLHAALLMLQHALTMPELERWRISTGKRTDFVAMSRILCNGVC
jgi:3',5'-cyclic-nucleotide phosphodiesterase